MTQKNRPPCAIEGVITMRVLLVRPPRIKQAITLSDLMFAEPIGLEMIYGVIKEKYDVEIYDMMIEKDSLTSKLKGYQPDVIGITSLCIDVHKVMDLAMEVKAFDQEITVVVGGTQTHLNPKAFFHESVDFIFEYTNEHNIKALFDHITSGTNQPVDGILSRFEDYQSTGVKGRNAYLLPDRTSTEKYRKEYSYFGYKPAAIMEFGVGCEKTCDFCLRWRIEGSRENILDLEIIKKDLLSIKESTIMLFDNDFFGNRKKIETFIQLIKELDLKKNYIVYGSVKGILEYQDLVKEFKGLGLKAVLVGYETFNDEEMITYKKKSTTSDNHMAANILKELGVDAWASFMAHPDWDSQDFKQLRRYVKELRPEIATINPLTPFPNLPMYKTYEDRLLFDAADYEKWSFGQVMIQPSKITLRRYYYELLKTNLYINLFTNEKTEMLRNYGIKNILRFTIGGLKTVLKYVKLMIRA